MIFDSDDFGANHVISDMCQSHDCRDMLMLFKGANPKFKATLFAIPGEMTPELYRWVSINSDWIEIAVHGFYHDSNYECEKMSYQEFDGLMEHSSMRRDLATRGWAKGFKAPGWQISDDIYKWLLDHDYWVADQSYNNDRRPVDLPAYINREGEFGTLLLEPNGIRYFHTVPAIHTHTWDCVGNGVYELKDQILDQIKDKDFKFISEVVQ